MVDACNDYVVDITPGIIDACTALQRQGHGIQDMAWKWEIDIYHEFDSPNQHSALLA